MPLILGDAPQGRPQSHYVYQSPHAVVFLGMACGTRSIIVCLLLRFRRLWSSSRVGRSRLLEQVLVYITDHTVVVGMIRKTGRPKENSRTAKRPRSQTLLCAGRNAWVRAPLSWDWPDAVLHAPSLSSLTGGKPHSCMLKWFWKRALAQSCYYPLSNHTQHRVSAE